VRDVPDGVRLFKQVEEFTMQDPNHDPYDSQEYEFSTLPYIPYASPSREQATPEPSSQALDDPTALLYGSPQSSLTETPPFIPAMPGAQETATEPVPIGSRIAPKRSRRKLWVLLGAIIAVLLLASGATYAFVSYINRPTPVKTLDVFCNALQHEDYQTAYNQFSKQLQSKLDEADFAVVLSQDKVVSCTHGAASDSGTKAVTSLKLVHTSKGINNDLVTLTKQENNDWKINDLQQA
jgi:hypothetical protein